MTGGLGNPRRVFGAAIRSRIRAHIAALVALALLLVLPLQAVCGDAVEISSKGASQASAPPEKAASQYPEEAPPAADAYVDEKNASSEGEPAGDSVSVASKGTDPQPKQLKLPLPDGTAYLEAYDRLEFDRDAGIAILEGDALVVIGEMQFEADYIELNEKAKNLYAKGAIALQQDDDVLYADEGYYSYDTTEFSLVNVSGNMSSADMEGEMYFTAAEAKGNFKEFDMWKVWVTTCPPYCNVYEYELRARKARVRRNNSVMLHHVYMYAREHKVFFFPELVIPTRQFRPLKQTESPIRQDYGYNTNEGYFAKFAYTYMNDAVEDAGAVLLGAVLLVISEKQGPGFGLRHDLNGPLGITTMRGFYQRQFEGDKDSTGVKADPASNYNYEVLQELNFSPDIKGDMSFKRNNTITAYRGRSNTWNNQFHLAYNKPNTSIILNASQNTNVRGSTQSTQTQTQSKDTNESMTFSYDHQFNRLTDISITQNVSGSKTNNGQPMNLEGDFKSALTYNRPDYRVSLRYEEDMDLDGNRYTGDDLQQISALRPGFQIQFNRSAFGNNSILNGATFSLDNVLDRRRNDTTTGPVLRFKFNTRASRTYSNSETTFTPSLEFTQYMYGDGNAQYLLNPSFSLRYTNNEWFSYDLQWTRSIAQGVKIPPVRSDRLVSRHNSTFGMDFYHDRWWKVAFRSSYDFREHKWGQISGTWTMDPSLDLSASVRATYNPETTQFGSVTTDIKYWAPSGNWWLDTNATLDVQGYSFKDRPVPASSFRWVYSRKYKRGWNFYVYSNQTRNSKGAFLDRVQIQKRNTCTTLNFGYSYNRKEYYINIFINAFPKYPVSLTAAEQTTNDWDFNFSTPVGDMFDVQRGLTTGWGSYGGYY